MKAFKQQKSRCITLDDFDETEENQFQKEYEFSNHFTITKMLKE